MRHASRTTRRITARPRLLSAIAATALAVGTAAGCGGTERDRAAPSGPSKRVVAIVQDDAELLHRSPQRIAATLDDLRGLGVDWVRVTAGWSVIAPDPTADRRPAGFDAADPGAYPDGAWDALDRLQRLTRRRGLRIAIDIAFWAPRWAVARPNADREQRNERSGIDPGEFAAFAQAVARRYPDAAAFTIWNEPNHTAFLLPQWQQDPAGNWTAASPQNYRDMLRASVPKVKAAAPDAVVLIGATSSLGTAQGTDARERMSPLTFARRLACVDDALRPDPRQPGCAGFTPLPGDGWSHHPYAVDVPPSARDPRPETVRLGDLDRLTTLLHALHAAGRTTTDLPVYLTEFGYQTSPPDPTQEVSLADQAAWVAEAEQVARSHPEVRATAQFLVRDLPERPGDDLRTRWRDYQSGLRFEDGRPKPAYLTYAVALAIARAQEAIAAAP
ncbi:hypothetical protein [Paraconexibacter sp. AEG42_29]|uniref:hypothetical protein n=1 Tax=Paraconexibacter sp. AEG42_29 TaxID=2997339 RepID=UPI00339D7DCF